MQRTPKNHKEGFIYQSDQSQAFPGLGTATCWGLGLEKCGPNLWKVSEFVIIANQQPKGGLWYVWQGRGGGGLGGVKIDVLQVLHVSRSE